MSLRAAIDVGTNSVRLLVTDGGAGAPIGGGGDVDRSLTITRLGEGVDAARALQPEPVRRTIEAIARYASRARELGVAGDRIRACATSAVRDAANRDEFLVAVRDAAGVTLECISGDEEARLSFAGAAASFEPRAPKLVVDIGGGSTEFVAGDTQVRAAISVDAGSVRLTERHVTADPPPAADQAAVRAGADAAVAAARAAVGAALRAMPGEPVLIGVAGTITTAAAIALDLPGYDRDAIHRHVLARETVAAIRGRLASMTSAQRRTLPAMPPGREDVIVAGAILLEAAMDGFGFDAVTVSETDILDGIAASIS